MKLWNFENTIARNLDAGGSASPSGGEPASGGGNGSPAASGGAPAATTPPANLLEAAQRAAGTDANGNAQQPPANGQQPPPAQNGNLYLPDGLPEQFRGKSDKETIDRLAEHIGKLPKAPASAKDYKFEPPPEFAAKFGDLKNDPVLKVYSEAAHKHGLSNDQYQALVVDLYSGLEKAGMLVQDTDVNAELQKLMPKDGDPKENARRTFERINNLSTMVKGLEARGVITKQQAADLGVMWSSAAAVQAFEKIVALIPKEHGPQGGGVGGGGSSEDQLRAEMKDPRYDTLSPKYDKAFRSRVDADWRRLHSR